MISFKQVYFLVAVFSSTANHTPLNSRCLIKWCVGLKHVSLDVLDIDESVSVMNLYTITEHLV